MAIMVSSGKSRSIAAALLLVAVVACTCAASVQAQTFTITNLSTTKTIIITTGGTPNTVTLAPGTSVAEPLSFFVNPVTVTIVGTPNVTITIPAIVVDFIRLQIRLGLQRIDINTVGNGVIIFATFPLPLLPLLPPLVLPFGPFF